MEGAYHVLMKCLSGAYQSPYQLPIAGSFAPRALTDKHQVCVVTGLLYRMCIGCVQDVRRKCEGSTAEVRMGNGGWRVEIRE